MGPGGHLDISLTHCVARWMNPRLAALEDHFWLALVRALPLPDFAASAHKHDPGRAAAAADINAAIAGVLVSQDCENALGRLTAADVPVADVVALDELASRPALTDAGLFVGAAAGPLLRFPIALAGVQVSAASQPPPD